MTPDNFRDPVHVIARKRDGHPLAPGEIASFIADYARGELPDYQMSALAMAIYWRGMTTRETVALTDAMLRSGARLDWSADSPPKVDKHSTGGVGDKVSLVLAPVLACCGLQVPMISGRGLGSTGGTLDKLEAIPGFDTNLSLARLRDTVERVGCAITGPTSQLVPADRKLYALRDVTATVGSIPLITASILSKKLAEDLSALVLDVKSGSGALMKSIDEARFLARSLVTVGMQLGLPTSALLTDMNQPLGRMVGHAVEVNESVETLEGNGPDDLLALVLELGTELLLSTKTVRSDDEGRDWLQRQIDSGRALEKFREMVEAQGGNLGRPLSVAPARDLLADRSGYITEMDAEALGRVLLGLGGARRVKTDTIDHSVGLQMLVRVGDPIQAGQPLVRIFAQNEDAHQVQPALIRAIRIGHEPPDIGPLVAERLLARAR